MAGDMAPPGQTQHVSQFVRHLPGSRHRDGTAARLWIGPAFGVDWLYLSGAFILLLASLLHVVTFSSARLSSTLVTLRMPVTV